MEKIASFSVDHLKLRPGLYVSRVDGTAGKEVTTFDIRLTAPNREPPVDVPALHTIEHLGATYLRNNDPCGRVAYFGPMGCRTGCYLLMFGRLAPEDVIGIVKDMCSFIMNYDGDIPGAHPDECGNWQEHNLTEAKYYISRYLRALQTERNTVYPS